MTISYELLIGIIIFLTSVIGFFLVRFIKSIDQMNEILNQLREYMNELQSESKVHKTLCNEKHLIIDRKFKRLDEHVGNLYKAHNDNRDKIAEIREERINNMKK